MYIKLPKNLERNFPLKNLTTFKTGGNARYFINARSVEDIINAIKFARDRSMDFFILGNGSNVLFSDQGFDGVVIKIGMKNFVIKDNGIIVEAGVFMPKLVREVSAKGLTGLEEFIGIPGSVGGCIYMNAGTKNKEIKDVIKSVKLLDTHTFEVYDLNEIKFSYRTSNIKNAVILSGVFNVQPGEISIIKRKIKEELEIRRKTQPVASYNAGCIFKNPPGLKSGELIEKLGLKGYKINGAMVSTRHANFIINDGNATSSSILKLIRFIQNEVYEKTGIKLELELRLVGF